jgi:formate-dependent nitrite reductase membrane component NrfD
MNEIDIIRHNELIDPYLQIWGWQVAGYLFLGGMAAGIMILAALGARRRDGDDPSLSLRLAPFAVLALISVGMLLLLADLEAKRHVYRFYMAFRPVSPMSWGAWILVLIYPAALLAGLAGLTQAELRAASAWPPVRALRIGKVLELGRDLGLRRPSAMTAANVVLGVGLGLYTGILLGTLGARPLWGSTWLAPLFLVSGLSTGAAFLMLLPVQKAEHEVLRRWDLAAIGLEVLVLGMFFLEQATSGAAGRAEVARFFGGDLTLPFWSLVVVTGLAVPATLEVVEGRRGLPRTWVAPALVLVGGVALRWIFVVGGQAAAA